MTEDTAEDRLNGHRGDLAEEYGTETESDPWSQEEQAIAEEAGVADRRPARVGELRRPVAAAAACPPAPLLRDELAELLDYEKANGNRPSFVGMLTRRIATVRDQQ